MSGLDKTGTKYPGGINVDEGKLFINSTAVTTSAAELNKLDGVTATTAQINFVAEVTAGTAAASKAVVADANVSIAGLGIRFNEASHDYAGAAADWTLSATEKNAFVLKVTNANGGCAIVAPAESGRVYLVDNQSGQACTIKKTGGTGISIASTKRAIVWYGGSDYVRITADA